MINTDQFDRLLDNDDLYAVIIELILRDHDDLLRIIASGDALAELAMQFDCSPAAVSRIAQFLTNDLNYRHAADHFAICTIHRTHYEICTEDGLHPYDN